MGIKDIDLNKDGVTLGDHINNIKEKLSDWFDGDETNSDNVVDNISHQVIGSNAVKKIDEITHYDEKKAEKEEKKTE